MRIPLSLKSFFRSPRIIIILVVGACVVVAAGVMGAQWYHNTPNQHISRALNYLEESDAPIARVDEALNAPLSTETTQQVRSALRAITVARRALTHAQHELDGLPYPTSTSLRPPTDMTSTAAPSSPSTASSAPATTAPATRDQQITVRLAKVQRSLAARRALLDSAPPLLDRTAQAAAALNSAALGWQKLQDAAALTDTAQQQFAQQTQDALVASHDTSTQAADAYARAHEQFTAAARTLPEADFSAYLDYIGQRILMTQSALLSCEDWINGHYQDANADVAAYNKFAQAAARIAGEGLQLPSDLVASTYKQQTKAAQQTYDRARAEVLRADAELR